MIRVGDVLTRTIYNGDKQSWTIENITELAVNYVSDTGYISKCKIEKWLTWANTEDGEFKYKSKYDSKFEAHKKRMLAI